MDLAILRPGNDRDHDLNQLPGSWEATDRFALLGSQPIGRALHGSLEPSVARGLETSGLWTRHETHRFRSRGVRLLASGWCDTGTTGQWCGSGASFLNDSQERLLCRDGGTRNARGRWRADGNPLSISHRRLRHRMPDAVPCQQPTAFGGVDAAADPLAVSVTALACYGRTTIDRSQAGITSSDFRLTFDT
jgi:hypothetical protein